MDRSEETSNSQQQNLNHFCIKCRTKTGNTNETVVDKVDKRGCTRKVLKSQCVTCGSNKGCCLKGSKVVKPPQQNSSGKDVYIKLSQLPDYMKKMLTLDV